MKIAEYKQIDTRTEEYIITVPAGYDEDGNIITEERSETRIRQVPVMGVVYRESEDSTDYENTTAEEPTQADRMEAQIMYTALMTDTLLGE